MITFLRDRARCAGETTEIRRAEEPGAGQHPAGGRADGLVHLQHVHDNQRPLHGTAQHGAGAVHRVRVTGADVLPDRVHTGRVAQVVRHARPDTQEARPGDRHVPVGQQPGHVGHQHAGEVPGRLASHTAALLRAVGLDDNHARVHAACHILQVPLDRVPVRDMETFVQNQTVVHVTAYDHNDNRNSNVLPRQYYHVVRTVDALTNGWGRTENKFLFRYNIITFF